MEEHENNQDIFRNDWCPLLGGLFYADEHYQLSEINRVISDARDLLGAMGNYAVFFDSNWPTVKKIEDHNIYERNRNSLFDVSVDAVLVIREIANKYSCIAQFFSNCYEGEVIETEPILLWQEQTLSSARAKCCEFHTRKDVPDSVILATLSIQEAFNQAKDIVFNNEVPDLSHSYELLRAAASSLADEEIADKEQEIEILKPLADKELQAQASRTEGGFVKSENYWQRTGISRKELEALANEKAKINPSLTNNRIYELLSEKTSIPKSTIRDNIQIKR